MKKSLLLLALFAYTYTSLASAPLRINDIVNVWAIEGIKSYDDIPNANTTPNFTIIPYSTKVVIMDTSLSTETFTMPFKNAITKQTYYLKGYWVLVEYGRGDARGDYYVFSGFLSKMPCFKKGVHGFESDEAYLKRVYNEPLVTVKKVRSTTVTTRTYKNNIIELESAADGCIGYTLQLSGITEQEAVLFEQVSLFEADAANDIKLRNLKNGSIRLSYNSCD
jgi:hypothetical protein